MSSDKYCSLQARLDRFLEHIEPIQLSQKFDEPIDLASEDFIFPEMPCKSIAEFLTMLAEFVRNVHKAASSGLETLSTQEAKAEALFILDSAYENSSARGLFAAFLDHSNSEFDGLSAVRHTITLEYKSRVKARYSQWLISGLIDPLDWESRVELAELLLRTLSAYVEDNAWVKNAERMAHEIPTLLSLLLEVNSVTFFE